MYTDTSIAYGTKYDKNIGVADIAKLVRADIKAGIKAGTLPAGLKCSVKISRYSMGQSLTVSVKAVSGIDIVNPAFIAAKVAAPDAWPIDINQTSDEARALLEDLRAIVSAYNYDGSDSMTDYYNVNFSGSVDIHWKLLSKLVDEGTAAALTASKPRIHLRADCVEVPDLHLV